MAKASIKKFKIKAKQIRRSTIKLLYKAQSGHPGSALSIVDLIVPLYFGDFFKHNPKNPTWEDRDYFLLSNGHAVPGLYALLAHAGYFDVNKLTDLRQINSLLHGHPKKDTFPGIEVSSGSLGQNLAVGLGIALGLKLKKQTSKVYVMTSDGEQQEGSTWEAVMYASKLKLNNLVAIVDKNQCQINGYTKDIMPSLDTLKDKYQSFGWDVSVIDGHNYSEILAAFKLALKANRPFAIIANTKIGKGVSYMEGDYHWHHGVLDEKMLKIALMDLS